MNNYSENSNGMRPAVRRSGRRHFSGLFLSALIAAAMTCSAFLPAAAASADTSEKAAVQELPSVSKEDEAKLLSVFQGALGKVEVDDFCVSDYNRDGKPEAFALVGDEDEFGAYTGSLYFVTENQVTPVVTDESFWPYHGDRRMLRFDSCDFYLIGKYYTTGDATYIFGVNENGWYEHVFSLQGMALTQISRSPRMTIVLSEYDREKDKTTELPSGHTWKDYYLYWDGDFKEYGGIEISEADLLTCKGASEYVDMIRKAGCQIGRIYYRENGVININYSREDDVSIAYENMTLQLQGDTVTAVTVNEYDDDPLGKLSYGGVYLPALYAERATYPKAFKPVPVEKK